MNNSNFKSVRSPSLVPGGVYCMRSWTSKPGHTFVYYAGYIDENYNAAKMPGVNKMKGYMNFVDMDGVPFIGVMRDCAVVRRDTGVRITFSDVVSTDEPVAEAPVADVVEAVAETSETASERRNRVRRQRRAAAKSGDAGATA